MNEQSITFVYDEQARRWKVFANGMTSKLEALQAFNAVVIAAKCAIPRVECNKATPTDKTGEYKISVGQYFL